MLPNRQARRMLERMGMSMVELEGVKEIEIKLKDGRALVMRDPSVYQLKSKDSTTMITAMGQLEEAPAAEAGAEGMSISEDDVKLVMERTGASQEEAIRALVESEGDLAAAILRLQQGLGSGGK